MLFLTCTMISSVDFAHYRVPRAKDWIFVDCDTKRGCCILACVREVALLLMCERNIFKVCSSLIEHSSVIVPLCIMVRRN